MSKKKNVSKRTPLRFYGQMAILVAESLNRKDVFYSDDTNQRISIKIAKRLTADALRDHVFLDVYLEVIFNLRNEDIPNDMTSCSLPL